MLHLRQGIFSGLRPISRRGLVRDFLACVNLASINIPQVLGYARIALRSADRTTKLGVRDTVVVAKPRTG